MKSMPIRFSTVTELKAKATQIVSEIQKTGKAMVITKNGKPVVLMRAVSEKEFSIEEPAEHKKKGGEKRHGKRNL